MATLAQQNFAEGFAALLEGHGSTWLFRGYSCACVASVLEADDPRMPGSGDRVIEVRAPTRDLRYPYPRRGDETASDGLFYSIVRVDHDKAIGLTVILVKQDSPMEAPPPDEAITDEHGGVMTDENGNPITATPSQITDEDSNPLTDQNGNPITTA